MLTFKQLESIEWERTLVSLDLELRRRLRALDGKGKQKETDLVKAKHARVSAYPVAEGELREMIAMQCGYEVTIDMLSRELVVTVHRAEYGRASSALISVDGSPPKGELWIVGLQPASQRVFLMGHGSEGRLIGTPDGRLTQHAVCWNVNAFLKQRGLDKLPQVLEPESSS